MFNLQGSEIVIILLLALVVLGPEKLPDAMRKAGKAYSELKKMSTGFQSEFRAVVDEPMREIRETANVLRDSADFTKLQDGERAEKPKSGEMAAVDPDAVPTDDTPTFETPEPSGPTHAADSEPAPFDDPTDDATDDPADNPSPRRSTERTPIAAPAPFTGMSSAAPRPEDARTDADDEPEQTRPQPFSGVSSAAPRPTADVRQANDSQPTPDASEPPEAERLTDADSTASSEPGSDGAEREAAGVDGDR